MSEKPESSSKQQQGETQPNASEELRKRFGEARKVLSEAQGWIREADPEMFGFNTREEVEAHLQQMQANVDLMIDAANGNLWSQAQVKWMTLAPQLQRILSITRVLRALGGL